MKSLSMEDIDKALKEIGIDLVAAAETAVADVLNEEIKETTANNSSNSGSSSSFESSKSLVLCGSSGNFEKKVAKQANSDKNIQNMSIEDLESELKSSKKAVSAALDEYMESAKEIAPEITKQLELAKTNAEKTQTDIYESNEKVDSLTNEKDGYELDLANAKASVSSINGQI